MLDLKTLIAKSTTDRRRIESGQRRHERKREEHGPGNIPNNIRKAGQKVGTNFQRRPNSGAKRTEKEAIGDTKFRIHKNDSGSQKYAKRD